MKISSLIDIIEGELINSPSISFIYNIKTNAKKVNEGDLYIAKNPNDLALAIKNGAFAIIYDFYTPILDKEIAWIQVKSYKDALIKIFRFKLSTLDLEAYSCNTITYDLLNIYKNKSFKFISSNLENCIKIIENIKDKDILFSCDENLLNKIYPKFSNFNNTKFKITNVVTHSMFESTFKFDNRLFSKVKISSLYLKEFVEVYNFCKEDFDITKLKNFNNMKALFLDKNCNVSEYGKSDKFLLAQKDYSLVNNEIDFIRKNYSYAKIIYISSINIPDFKDELFVINNVKNLQNFLKTKSFNCAYLISYDFEKVEKTLTKPLLQYSLF